MINSFALAPAASGSAPEDADVRAAPSIAAQRVVAELAAGRAIAVEGLATRIVAAPLDGPVRLSDTLALSEPRARYLGLAEGAVLVRPRGPAADLWPLATAAAIDRSAVSVEPAGLEVTAALEAAKLAERLPALTIAADDDRSGALLAASADALLSLRATLAGTLSQVATAPVPLASGANATVHAFRNASGGTVSAVVVPPSDPGSPRLVRVHSSCVTGDIFGSLKCDCGAQLALALDRIAAEGGVLVYTAQEGRGIGLVNKLRAYTLQDDGLDTVDANLALGYHDDERDYLGAAAVLRQLGVAKVRLLTNNPAKAQALAQAGLTVTTEPLTVAPGVHNARYLATKKARSGHIL